MAGKGLKVTEAMTAGLVSWSKHRDNPWLTSAQRNERIIAETGASVGKTALTMGAAFAAGGAAAGVIAGPGGVALGYGAGMAVGTATGVALHFADKAGLTELYVDGFGTVVGAAGDAVIWERNAKRDAREWTARAVVDVAQGAGEVLGAAGKLLPKPIVPPIPKLPGLIP